MDRERSISYKVDVDQNSLRQSMMNMQSMHNASSNMQGPYFTQQVHGYAQAGWLGFNSLMSDLKQIGGAIPGASIFQDPSSINKGFIGSALGVGGYFTPNTMYRSQNASISQNDISARISSASAAAGISATRFGLDMIPSTLGYGYGASLATAAGWGSYSTIAAGLAGGAVAGLVAAPTIGAIGYGLNMVEDSLSTQHRLEGMFGAISRNKLGISERNDLARKIRMQVVDDPILSNNGALETIAYATEAGMIRSNFSPEKFERKTTALLDSVKTIMRTFHQVEKDAVKTMAELESTGVLSANQLGTEGIITESRSLLAGLTSGQMMAVRSGASRTGYGSRMGMYNAGTLGTLGAALAGSSMSEDRIMFLGGAPGAAGIQNISGDFAGSLARFSSSGAMKSLAAAFLNDDGKMDQSLLGEFLSGKTTSREIMERTGVNIKRFGYGKMQELAGDAIKNMSETDLLMSPFVLASMQLKNNRMEISESNMKQTLMRSFGFGEAGAELMSGMVTDQDSLRNVYTNQRGKLLEEETERRVNRESLWNRGKSWFHGGAAGWANLYDYAGDNLAADFKDKVTSLWSATPIDKDSGGALGDRDVYRFGEGKEHLAYSMYNDVIADDGFTPTGAAWHIVKNSFGFGGILGDTRDKMEWKDKYIKKIPLLKKLALNPEKIKDSGFKNELLSGMSSRQKNVMNNIISKTISNPSDMAELFRMQSTHSAVSRTREFTKTAISNIIASGKSEEHAGLIDVMNDVIDDDVTKSELETMSLAIKDSGISDKSTMLLLDQVNDLLTRKDSDIQNSSEKMLNDRIKARGYDGIMSDVYKMRRAVENLVEILRK